MKALFALAVTFLWVSASEAAAASASRPNIVFIFADDWGWGDLSCHGHPWVKTPNLDRLAREGTDFQQFNVLNPVCSPSRTAVMTGQYPARYSVHQHFAHPTQNHERGMPDWLDPKAPTLPRMLKGVGYRTAHYGKWHLSNSQTEGAPKPEAYGYDEWAVYNGGAGWPVADVHATAENTAAFIRANRGRPFFVNAWLHESHTPHFPTKESMEMWKHLEEKQRVYSAVITDGDKAVGKILDALKAEELENDTIVMFSSDNGPESTGTKPQAKRQGADTGYDTRYSIGQTGGLRGRKRSLFEGGVRVPFIVRWPGHTPAGARNERTVFTAVDLLPTLCEAAGVAAPAEYRGDGETLLGAFEGREVVRTRPIFWEWRGNAAEPDWWPRLAVREGDWKLLMTADAGRLELHKVTEDRAEVVDVAKDYPEVVARLSNMALEWKKTLPEKPNPECLTTSKEPEEKGRRKAPARAAVTPEARAIAFARWDTNQDGVLSVAEYEVGLEGQPDLAARLKRFDRDGDGKVTREEFVGGPATGNKKTSAVGAARPNIVLVLTDDQGYGDLGRHGHPLLKTPNLDLLHNQSVRLENFYVSPSCSPTRAALLTGMHEFRNGVTHTRLPREHLSLEAVILPQLLKAAGYRTGFVGKWHLGNDGDYAPRKRGFDWWSTPAGGGVVHFDPVMVRNGKRETIKGFREDIFFDEAMTFIEENRSAPFFCFLATYSPHAPLAAPEGDVAPYLDKVGPDEAKYLGMVANIDANVGRLMEHLLKLQLETNTVVIFMNDNGATYGLDAYNAGMRGCKCTIWQGGSRAMSFWRWPGHWHPHAVEHLTAHLDVLPTLCDLAGANVPEEVRRKWEGFSLRPLLEAEEKPSWPVDRLLFHHVGRWPSGMAAAHKYAMASVQSGEFLLTRSEPCEDVSCQQYASQCATLRAVARGAVEARYTKSNAQVHWGVTAPGRWSLYNLNKDRMCENDLAAANPHTTAKLAAAYEQWWDGIFPAMIAAGGDKGVPEKVLPASPGLED